MRNAKKLITVAAAALAVSLAACGGGSSPPAGDVTACRHYVQQGQKLKDDATPSLADLALAPAWVTEDAALAAAPALKAALTQDANAISDLLGSFGASQARQDAIAKQGDAAAAKIASICAADGVALPAQ